MNELFIGPNVAKKTMRLSGVIAAGEHVRVTVRNRDGFSADTTRLRVMCGEMLVAQFPMPKSGDSWESDDNDISCVLNLNTVQAERVTKCAPAPCLFVLDDVSSEVRQLYGTSTHRLERWVKSPDNDTPINLDKFPSVIDEFRADIAEWKMQVGDALEDYQRTLSSAWNGYRNSLDSHFSQLAASVYAAVADKAEKSDFDSHASANNNPHHVTAEQIGAATTSDVRSVEEMANEAKGAADASQEAVEKEEARASAVELALENKITEEAARAIAVETSLANSVVDATNAYKSPLKDESDRAKERELSLETGIIDERNRAQGEERWLAETKADLVGGKVPASQLPSYVDDVLEFTSVSTFPAVGEAGKIYIAKDTNRQYRWSGTQYVQLGGGGAGEDTNAVHYYAETKTDAQKERARRNIGAGTSNVTLDDTVTQSSANGVKSSGIWSFVKGLIGNLTGTVAEALDGRREKLDTATYAWQWTNLDRFIDDTKVQHSDKIGFASKWAWFFHFSPFDRWVESVEFWDTQEEAQAAKSVSLQSGGETMVYHRDILPDGGSLATKTDVTEALADKADSVDVPQMAKDAMASEGINNQYITIGGPIVGQTVSDQDGDLRDSINAKANRAESGDADEIATLDENGNPTRSGIAASRIETVEDTAGQALETAMVAGGEAHNANEAISILYTEDLPLKADRSMISADDETFSNAVLAVEFPTNVVAQIGELNEFIHDYGGMGATTLGGLLAALLTAVAWLKKNKADKSELPYMMDRGDGRYEYTGALADAETRTYPREVA